MQVYRYIIVAFFLFSCLQTKREGLIFEEEKLAQVKVGMTKQQIITLLGTPSFVLEPTSHASEQWVYLSIEKQWRAFFTPNIKSQKILEFEFSGNVASKLKIFTEADIPKTRPAFKESITQPNKP